MSARTVLSSTSSTQAEKGEDRPGRQLRGIWLRVVQGVWLLLVLGDLLVLITGLPAFYHMLFTICTAPIANCQYDQLTPQTLLTLQKNGFSLNTYVFYVMFWDILATLAYLLVGVVIVWRRANTWMGLFVSFYLINFASIGLSTVHIGALLAAAPDSLVGLASAIGIPLQILAYLCLAFFFFTFPDGRLVPRWSWVLTILWLVNAFFWVGPAPFNLTSWPPFFEELLLSLVFGLSVSTQLYRFLYKASPIQRQQIKWLIYGFMPIITLPLLFALVISFIPGLNQPGAMIVNTPNSFLLLVTEPLFRFFYLPIPFCVGIALLRYRLWDIDTLINRTLVYGLLTATLLLVYLALILAGQALVVNVFNISGGVVLVISTLAVAALFQPLRLRVQRLVDRRFYRSKYDATLITARFGAALRQEVDLEQLSSQLLTVVRETMQPAHLSLWLRPRTKPAQTEEQEMDRPLP